MSRGGADDSDGAGAAGGDPLYRAQAQLLSRYNWSFGERLHALVTRAIAAPDARTPAMVAALLVQLNHIHDMDDLWLGRLIRGHVADPPPPDADPLDIAGWWARWRRAAAILDAHVAALDAALLADEVVFVTRAERVTVRCPHWAALTHLFNHQALHRGEVLRILRGHGVDFGNSDILPLIVTIDEVLPCA